MAISEEKYDRRMEGYYDRRARSPNPENATGAAEAMQYEGDYRPLMGVPIEVAFAAGRDMKPEYMTARGVEEFKGLLTISAATTRLEQVVEEIDGMVEALGGRLVPVLRLVPEAGVSGAPRQEQGACEVAEHIMVLTARLNQIWSRVNDLNSRLSL